MGDDTIPIWGQARLILAANNINQVLICIADQHNYIDIVFWFLLNSTAYFGYFSYYRIGKLVHKKSEKGGEALIVNQPDDVWNRQPKYEVELNKN